MHQNGSLKTSVESTCTMHYQPTYYGKFIEWWYFENTEFEPEPEKLKNFIILFNFNWIEHSKISTPTVSGT